VRLGEVIKKWRVMSEKGLRETAKDIGINASTLVRIEAGEGMDAQTLAAVLRWLMEAANEHPQR
jgi:transcriptional regulator with XRE-family HTH domain